MAVYDCDWVCHQHGLSTTENLVKIPGQFNERVAYFDWCRMTHLIGHGSCIEVTVRPILDLQIDVVQGEFEIDIRVLSGERDGDDIVASLRVISRFQCVIVDIAIGADGTT